MLLVAQFKELRYFNCCDFAQECVMREHGTLYGDRVTDVTSPLLYAGVRRHSERQTVMY